MKAVLDRLGIRYFKSGGNGGWVQGVKLRPANADEWSHVRHGPDGNPVSADDTGIPEALQWLAGPSWPLSVRKGSTLAMISAGGRNFYFLNGPPLLALASPKQKEDFPRRFSIVARDAYNGVLLWEKVWHGYYDGAEQDYAPLLPMAATANAVYAFYNNEVVALDAETGELKVRYDRVLPRELLVADNTLVVGTGNDIRAYDADTGKSLWKVAVREKNVLINDGLVVALTNFPKMSFVGIDLRSGVERWQAELSLSRIAERLKDVSLRFCRDGLVVGTSSKSIFAHSSHDGKLLWTQQVQSGFGGDGALLQGGLVWTAGDDGWHGLDPASGELKRKITTPVSAGCGQISATGRYLLASRRAGFAEFKTGNVQELYHEFPARGPCRLSFMPANGLVYSFPHGCRCVAASSVNGYLALHANKDAPIQDDDNRLEKGAAFGMKAVAAKNTQDWPTYRHDPQRSGTATSKLAVEAKVLWEAEIEPRSTAPEIWESADAVKPLRGDWGTDPIMDAPITSPVVADGAVYIAATHSHRVVSLEAATGKQRWEFIAGGPIDSPPTIYMGLCLFGCYDGYVYCLRAEDGHLVWRLRAAPEERRIVAFGQLESPWPVSGSILVADGTAYFAAGRVGYAEGGVTVYAVDPLSGEIAWKKTTKHRADVMVSAGQHIYLGWQRFDPRTGTEQTTKEGEFLRAEPFGLLYRIWTHNPALGLRKNMSQWQDGRGSVGQLLVVDQRRTIGYGYEEAERFERTKLPFTGLFSAGYGGKPASRAEWALPIGLPAQVEAMLLAADTVCAAGPTNSNQRDAGFLWLVSAAKGNVLSNYDLPAPPVYDGLAAGQSRLYVSLVNGKLRCYGTK